MIIALYIVAAVIMAIGSLYLAWRNTDFRKFLAGVAVQAKPHDEGAPLRVARSALI